ncbi:hypothetical protein [Actinocorallia longicatena]|uniref:Uncharacterized protein n=1 Tax=Actinocorallia longicatena TaxID=111803 RepID=A0ABP6Q8K8_9ACTN
MEYETIKHVMVGGEWLAIEAGSFGTDDECSLWGTTTCVTFSLVEHIRADADEEDDVATRITCPLTEIQAIRYG